MSGSNGERCYSRKPWKREVGRAWNRQREREREREDESERKLERESRIGRSNVKKEEGGKRLESERVRRV